MALRAFDGGAFFGEVSGNGPGRVLALHGWGRRGSDFAASLQGLDYIALDLPGFGASPPPSEAMGAKEYASFISPVLAELGQRPILVGHSFGGRVAVMLADGHPEVVAGVVLIGVPLIGRPDGRRSPLPYRMGRWAHRRRLISAERMEQLRRQYGSEDYRTASGVMRETLVRVVNESYEAELARMRMPVRLLWGTADTEVPPELARKAEAILRQAGAPVTLELIDDVGHWLPTQAPAELRRVVEEILEWT